MDEEKDAGLWSGEGRAGGEEIHVILGVGRRCIVLWIDECLCEGVGGGWSPAGDGVGCMWVNGDGPELTGRWNQFMSV